MLRPSSRKRLSAALMGNPVNPRPFRTTTYLQSTLQDQSLAGRWIASGGPRWATLLDEGIFVLGSLMFVVGSYDFYPGTPFPKYVEGCELFIVGSLLFLGLSLFAAFEIFSDAKLTGKPPNAGQLFEESLYILGSALFWWGTVEFTPPLNGMDGLDGVAQAAAGAASAAWDYPGPEPLVSVKWFGKTIELVVNDVGQLPEASEAEIEKGDLLFVLGSIVYSMAGEVATHDAPFGAQDAPAGHTRPPFRIRPTP